MDEVWNKSAIGRVEPMMREWKRRKLSCWMSTRRMTISTMRRCGRVETSATAQRDPVHEKLVENCGSCPDHSPEC